jgi:predicted 2-oxoglutarate/Fe(II)-dependent dioxygenase YbiX
MDAGAPEPAELLGMDVQLDERVRRASLVEVDGETLRFLEGRLDEARDRAARYFGVTLTAREGTSIVRYPAGGFFRPHRDRGDVESWPAASLRRIAVVVFLNSSRDVEAGGDFTGGRLRLFGDEEQTCLDVSPEAGTLVAFPASTLHEVTTIEGGVRDAIVDWYR